ncbi:MAG: FkbM family methyltransferase [Clostridia bacterium]|jgi:spore coat polysaccharide biosynthesis protein SpsF (cytidylyltransferase family)|nr:FkbM family methyltransferase [Clostridia bacterium]
MGVICYIQADARYNKYLLRELKGETIIEHTIKRVQSLSSIEKIVIGLYDCEENKKFKFLSEKYDNLNIFFSKEEHVSVRMFQTCKVYNPKMIVRITGDKIFLDTKTLEEMIAEARNNDYDLYLSDFNNGLLADIVKFSAIENNQSEVFAYDRYYKYFLANRQLFDIKFYISDCNSKIYSFLIRNDLEYFVAGRIMNGVIDIDSFSYLSADVIYNVQVLHQDGWYRSVAENMPVNSKGDPIPWFTYPSIEFLATRIKKEMSIFEYGCGNSTLWWASHVKNVISVEHDETWYRKIVGKIPENVQLIHIPLEYDGDYSRKIGEYNNRFDIIVIDGRDRVNCVKNAINALKADGVIIWDNSDRQKYQEGYEFLYNNGFKSINFVGIVPSVDIKSETSIFYRSNNCLNI